MSLLPYHFSRTYHHERRGKAGEWATWGEADAEYPLKRLLYHTTLKYSTDKEESISIKKLRLRF